MKKFYAFLLMAATLAACTREEQPQNETPDQPESPTTYTLTVKASKGTGTRALELVGSTLKAYWDGNEKVTAHLNGEDVSMTIDLGGQSGQASCTLKGTFSQAPKAGDVLTLKLNGNDYTNQRGTLAFIGSNCDYAEATLHVSGVNGGQIESQEGKANFVNQQAIVKFTLKDKASDAAISPSAFIVKSNGDVVATVTGINANSGGVLFVAIPAISGTIDLTATVGSDTYTYSKQNVTFTAGEYYSITVKMTQKFPTVINLSDESLYKNGIFTAQDGYVLTGTFPTIDASKQIQIAKNATVTLNNVNIINRSTKTPGIALEGSATLILVGTNTVSANSSQPGILVGDPGTTLTIMGEGTLNATGDFMGAGIGSRGSSSSADVISCGDIVILGGTIIADSNRAAGIGCGSAVNGGTVSCGNITISSPAKVTATKGWGAPYSIGPSTSGHCGKVTIYGQVHWDENEGIRDPNGYLASYSLAIP